MATIQSIPRPTRQRPARPVRPARPALRLVDTRELARADWLQVRRSGIGSSDAAAAVGLSPYKSPLVLWLEKTGRDADLQRPDPLDTREPVYWGTLLEPIVAAAYTQQTGHRVRRLHAVLQHPSVPFMLANLDREVLGVPGVQVLECKTAGEFGARLWRAGVPEYVQLQVQHQLAVTGRQAADVAVLLCGQQLEVHRIERDEALIAHLIELEGRFWAYVQKDEPPPADGSASAQAALRCLYPRSSGQTLDWRQDRAMSALFCDLQAVRGRLAEDSACEARIKQQIQQAMGQASRARFESGEVSWRRSQDSRGLDTQRLLAEQPDLLVRFPKTQPGRRRFVIHD
ncbi:YqaJ viral recombinase family protein [Variovorax terrae]|uniref:YqaJ viral recombinase family protein n=1 Tax=Variovorax terrae TaxID=2923278 RepID=A0A9X1W089_9BURK|nr:YqaJ viral recombinase family protein [Variovorax terrae]MCJ0766200.1 YqaJ viral recombinase family protein [Variovorax terrae]